MEAAVLLPILFILLLILCQPAIVLYDRMVMSHSAAQGCRLIATSETPDSNAYKQAILSQLKAVPDIAIFHIKETNSWDVDIFGDENSDAVTICIKNRLKPLPLAIGVAALMGMVDSSGNIKMEVSATTTVQPAWLRKVGGTPKEWLEKMK